MPADLTASWGSEMIEIGVGDEVLKINRRDEAPPEDKDEMPQDLLDGLE